LVLAIICLILGNTLVFADELSVNAQLGKSLDSWMETHQRVPQLTSTDPEERLNAYALKLSLRVPEISQQLGKSAQEIVSSHPNDLPQSSTANSDTHYETAPLNERFHGEDQGKDLWSDRANKTIHFNVKYLRTDSERAPYKITIKNGVFLGADGKPFDSSQGDLRGLSNSKGRAMLVMDKDGNLFAANEQELAQFHHSSLVGGDPVAFAGEVIVENGHLNYIKNMSGHYTPPTEFFSQILDRFESSGVDISKVSLEAVPADPLTILQKRYSSEVSQAAKRPTWSESPYRLAYANESAASPREYVGNILRALKLQEGVVQEIISRNGTDSNPSAPKNDLKTTVGLGIVKARILGECRHCKTTEDWDEHKRAVNALFDVYDIQAGGAKSPRSKRKFSGLPFFSTVEKNFSDEAFRARTIQFSSELEKIVADFSKNPETKLNTNVMDIALKVCKGNYNDAINLAGVLLSRDSNVTRYFDYLPAQDPAFVKAVARTPLLVRLIAELDRVSSGSNVDRFSFDGTYTSPNVKNYYFWSSALVSKNLRDQGVSEKEIIELNAQFPRQYKYLRTFENFANNQIGKLRGKTNPDMIDGVDFLLDTRQVMRMSAEGSRHTALSFCMERSLKESNESGQ
jgi:hypothetical protein